MTFLPIIFIVAPLAIYLYVALTKKGVPVSAEEFFESRGLISSSEFANSSVAYGFQIASVSVFFAFGYHYGLGGIVNPLFWGLGIVFFMLIIGRLGDFFGTTQTLHGFLGSRYKSKPITVLASIMTIIGFLGAFTAEMVWGSYVMILINPNPWFIGISMTIMAAIVGWYVTQAGHLSVVKTDQQQLIFAYVAFVVLVVFLITLLHWQSPEARAVGLILSISTTVLLAVVGVSIFRQLKEQENSGTYDGGRTITIIVFVIIVTGSILSIVNTVLFSKSVGTISVALKDSRLYDFDQGALNLLSLAMLPLCWQFADVTMWQRLGATQLPSQTGPNRYRLIKRGLIRYAIESPVTWILALTAGVALRYADIGISDESIWNGIAEIPTAILTADTHLGTFVQGLVASLFAAGIVAAMLSTADSFLIGSTFTLAYDLAPNFSSNKTNFVDEQPQLALRLGRIASVVFIFVGLVSYWVATFFNVEILTILFGAFGAQVSLFPAVFGTLVLKQRAAAGGWALASIIFGFLAGLFAVSIALGDTTWALYPPLFALSASGLVYLFGVALKRKTKEN